MKTKRILSLLLAVSLVFTCAVAGIVLPASAEGTEPADYNMLTNGDFEDGASGWRLDVSYNSPTPEIGEGYGVNGSMGAKVTVQNPNAQGESSGQWPSVRYGSAFFSLLEKNTTYVFSFDYKWEGTGVGARFTPHLNTSKGWEGDWKQISDLKASDWTTVTMEFTTNDTIDVNATWEWQVEALIWASQTGTGAAYFDNFSLVKKSDLPALTGIALNKTEATIARKGNTVQLAVSAVPAAAYFNETVTWTSSNTAVATVDANGKVTAVSGGTATITATAGEYTATCTVTVTDYNVMPNGDFEDGAVKPWTAIGNATIEDGVGFGGSKGLVIPAHDEEFCKYAKGLSSVTLEDNTTYELLYMVKGPAFRININAPTNFTSYGDLKSVATNGNWMLCRRTVTTGTNPSFNSDWGFTLESNSATTEPTYVDNIIFRKVSNGAADSNNAVGIYGLADGEYSYLDAKWQNHLSGGRIQTTTDPDDSTNSVLKLAGDSSGWDPYLCTALEGNTNYLLTFRAKGNAFSVFFHNKNYTNISGWSQVPSSDDWVEYSYELTTQSSFDANYAFVIGRVYAGDLTGNDSYIDDIRLRKVTDVPAVTGIALNKTEATIARKGSTVQLAVSAVPTDAYFNETVTWTSNNTDVATVDDNGKVTAVSSGAATITATAGAFSATCTVTVPWPTEHFVNGSMDDSTEGITFDKMSNSKGATLSFETSGGVDDSGCLKVSGASADSNDFYFWNQSIVLRPNSFYKVSMMAKATGDVTNNPYITFKIVGGANATDCITNLTSNFYLKDNEWKECAFWICTGSNPSLNNNYNVLFDARKFKGDLYLDNFSLKLVEDEKGSVMVSGSSVTFNMKDSSNADVQCFDTVTKGTVIKMEVIPNANALLLPGNLTYTALDTGKVYKVLNKKATGYSEATFGTGTGHQFEFTKPNDGPGYFTAKCTAYGDTNYKMNTAGTSLRYTDAEGTHYDGIRFLTRLTMRSTFDKDAGTLTVIKNGVTYTVVEFGTLLKRADAADWNENWTTVAYKQGETDTMKLLDYCAGASWCPSYIDFAVTMKKGESVSDEVFEAREYTACGYMVLEAADDTKITVYSEQELTNSVANAKAAVQETM